MAELQGELDHSSNTEISSVMTALYRTFYETGALLFVMATFLYFLVTNLERRRTVESLRVVNADLEAAQAKLRAREQEARRLAQVAAGTTNAVLITDVTGRITWVNASFTRISGYSPEEVIGRIAGSFLHGRATSTEAVQEMRTAVAAGRGFQTEIINYNKAGQPYSVSIDCQPVTEQGEVTGFIEVQTDITERVRLEAEVREREHRMRLVFDHVLDGIVTISEQGLIAAANPAVGQIFGYKLRELIGQSINLLVPQALNGQNDSDLEAGRSNHLAKILGLGREVVGRRKDGSEFALDVAISEVYLDGQKQSIGILRDITVRRATEAAVRRSRKQLLDLTANLPGAVFQFRKLGNSIGEFLFVSKGLEHLCGRTADDVMRNSYQLLATVHPEDARAVKQELRRALRTDSAFFSTYRVKFANQTPLAHGIGGAAERGIGRRAVERRDHGRPLPPKRLSRSWPVIVRTLPGQFSRRRQPRRRRLSSLPP